ncbi:MAG: hypothetical protein IIB56_13700 [Planctomycetes bacterium]|nr:hypothetical protein [Planctomycetota bacterium]
MENIEKTTKKLSSRQINILNAMFSGDLTLNDILKSCRVSQITYYDWLSDSLFMSAFDKRVDSARAVLTSTLSAYSQAALLALVNLTRSEKTETARKACLDIVKLVQEEKDEQDAKLEIPNVPRLSVGQEVLSPEQSSSILNALAEGSR